MTDEIRGRTSWRSNKAMADKALRVLCGAQRDWDAAPGVL